MSLGEATVAERSPNRQMAAPILQGITTIYKNVHPQIFEGQVPIAQLVLGSHSGNVDH